MCRVPSTSSHWAAPSQHRPATWPAGHAHLTRLPPGHLHAQYVIQLARPVLIAAHSLRSCVGSSLLTAVAFMYCASRSHWLCLTSTFSSRSFSKTHPDPLIVGLLRVNLVSANAREQRAGGRWCIGVESQPRHMSLGRKRCDIFAMKLLRANPRKAHPLSTDICSHLQAISKTRRVSRRRRGSG